MVGCGGYPAPTDHVYVSANINLLLPQNGFGSHTLLLNVNPHIESGPLEHVYEVIPPPSWVSFLVTPNISIMHSALVITGVKKMQEFADWLLWHR